MKGSRYMGITFKQNLPIAWRDGRKVIIGCANLPIALLVTATLCAALISVGTARGADSATGAREELSVADGLIPEELSAAAEKDFDWETGNVWHEVAGPIIGPIIDKQISPDSSDASLLLHFVAMLTNSWFDATAPYQASAGGVWSDLGRRPPEESATNRNINIAILQASYRLGVEFFPTYAEELRAILIDNGLDPDDDSTDKTTPVGLANLATQAVIEGRRNDGMNAYGTDGGREHNPLPYADTTGYEPVNTPYEVTDPTRWQPALRQYQAGNYVAQSFVTPQYALVEPYTSEYQDEIRSKPPTSSQDANSDAYRDQADRVLKVSAELTDEQKIKAELFNNKFRSLGLSIFAVQANFDVSLLDWISLQFLVSVATSDSLIWVWREKNRYDAVRPFTAISYLYNDDLVTAWGGVGLGTEDIPANQWTSYLGVADHPEYPSATATLCAAHAQAARRYFESDELNFAHIYAKGSSVREPGITPSEDMELFYATWSDFEFECGYSRVWGGVHFEDAVTEGQRVGGHFGDFAYEYVTDLLAGEVDVREPAKPTSNLIVRP